MRSELPCGMPATQSIDSTNQYELGKDILPEHRCVRSALDPPRPIPNRVVQRRSAEGTGEMTPWETKSMHLRQR